MKKLTVEIIEEYPPTIFNYGGFDVQLTCGKKTVKAFVNLSNHVTVNFDVFLHSLFDIAPFTSEYADKVDKEVQAAFAGWDKTNTQLFVNI